MDQNIKEGNRTSLLSPGDYVISESALTVKPFFPDLNYKYPGGKFRVLLECKKKYMETVAEMERDKVSLNDLKEERQEEEEEEEEEGGRISNKYIMEKRTSLLSPGDYVISESAFTIKPFFPDLKYKYVTDKFLVLLECKRKYMETVAELERDKVSLNDLKEERQRRQQEGGRISNKYIMEAHVAAAELEREKESQKVLEEEQLWCDQFNFNFGLIGLDSDYFGLDSDYFGLGFDG